MALALRHLHCVHTLLVALASPRLPHVCAGSLLWVASWRLFRRQSCALPTRLPLCSCAPAEDSRYKRRLPAVAVPVQLRTHKSL